MQAQSLDNPHRQGRQAGYVVRVLLPARWLTRIEGYIGMAIAPAVLRLSAPSY